MAAYPEARFAPAADAWLANDEPTPKPTDTAAIRARATALADAWSAQSAAGENDPVVVALRSVASLRPSIARRFVTIGLVAAEARATTPKGRRSRKGAPKG